ncbi:MAG: hypothetical protein LBL97_07765 [Prevotellaceae bacterium]|jgi:antitoxin (DNA-binding transcriptional repressor) of toxin-antitoxin stability system|nr:hypothetical protein [Prevotellaceae bacterium]
MAVIQVTSSEFRARQAALLGRADCGDQIIISRNGKRGYMLTPIADDDDAYFTPEMLAKIDQSLQEAQEGKVVEYTPQLRKELFGDL